MKPVSIVLTIEDDTTKQAQMIVHVVNQSIVPDLSVHLEIARQIQIQVNDQIEGIVVGCGVVYDVPLDPSLRTVAAFTSSIHRKAIYIMETVDGWYCQTSVPTLDEAFVIPGKSKLDTDLPGIAAFIAGQLGPAAPVALVPSHLHVPGEAAPRPLGRPGDQAVLDGVEMYVVHVQAEVPHVADRVLPEAWLPDAAVAFTLLAGCQAARLAAGLKECLSEHLLDPTDAA